MFLKVKINTAITLIGEKYCWQSPFMHKPGPFSKAKTADL